MTNPRLGRWPERGFLCRWRGADLNCRPANYELAALPTELPRLTITDYGLWLVGDAIGHKIRE